MAIDPKQIEAFKALAGAGYPLALLGCPSEWRLPPENLGGEAAASEAISTLLAEREEMLALLREIEWSGTVFLDWDYSKSACPCCSGVKPEEWDDAYDDTLDDVRSGKIRKGHAPDCRLAAFPGSPR